MDPRPPPYFSQHAGVLRRTSGRSFRLQYLPDETRW